MQGEPFPVCAPSRTPTIPTVYVDAWCMYTISLCIYPDSRMFVPPWTPALGHVFLNRKLIRSSRRMDAVAAKSDVVTFWKCAITDAYRPLQTLTDADSRCWAFPPSTCDCVNPYPSVTGPLDRQLCWRYFVIIAVNVMGSACFSPEPQYAGAALWMVCQH